MHDKHPLKSIKQLHLSKNNFYSSLLYIHKFIFLVMLYSLFKPCQTSLIVYIDMKSTEPLKMISFCVDCITPEHDGSFVYGLVAKHTSDYTSIAGELIYCVPNHAENKKILNNESFYNRIIFVDRGKVSIIDKCQKIQSYGAIAIIIADDGNCDDNFNFCGSRAGSIHSGGFGSYDDPLVWKSITIPVLLINLSTAERMRKLMNIKRVKIPKIGMQNITLIKNKFGEYDEL